MVSHHGTFVPMPLLAGALISIASSGGKYRDGF
jgi:hypothetical protein